MIAAIRRVLSEPYRVFFLAAGLYAVFALLVWEFWLGVHFAGGMMGDMPFAPPPHLWHAHEMIFGYAGAALGGFFLTAVPGWTGRQAAAPAFVVLAVCLWLAGRLAMWLSAGLPAPLVAAVDLAFLPVLGLGVAAMLARRPKPQNLAFLAFLALVWIGNLMTHLAWLGLADTLATGVRAGLFALCLMIAVLGGRVTPAFTRNALTRAGTPEAALPQSRRALDIAAIVCIALVTLGLLAHLPAPYLGALALAGGLLQLLRMGFWAPHLIWRQPILWALHLGMAMLGAGLILWGLSLWGVGSEVAALHVLGIGAVGGMTLAVMSRAVLGHTGRALVAPGAVALAYGLVALAAALRWLASALSGEVYFPAMLLTGGLWILAFTLYLAALWPAFWGTPLSQEE